MLKGFLQTRPVVKVASQRSQLTIRSFVKGQDETAWISITNEYLSHFLGPDYMPRSQEYMEWFKRSPWYDPKEMFVAELDGKPIGVIRVRVDERAGRRHGTISIELRLHYVGTEYERQMLFFCLENLRSRGISYARTWVRDNMLERIRLLETEGFKKIRSSSVMKMRLSELKRGIGECKRIWFRPVELGRSSDIGLLTFLLNEAFKGQFGFRPTTVEENRAWLSQPDKELYGIFAYWGRTPVGYIVLEISKELVEAGRKVGEVSSIGVLRPYRRLGVGTALMLKGLEWLRSRGMEEAMLDVDDDNPTGAIRLYEKVGFRAAYKILVYEKSVST